MSINFEYYKKHDAISERLYSNTVKSLATLINFLSVLCKFSSYGTWTISSAAFNLLGTEYFQFSLNIRLLERIIFLSHHGLFQV